MDFDELTFQNGEQAVQYVAGKRRLRSLTSWGLLFSLAACMVRLLSYQLGCRSLWRVDGCQHLQSRPGISPRCPCTVCRGGSGGARDNLEIDWISLRVSAADYMENANNCNPR